MSATCIFEFDQVKSVYYSGEFVKGRILLTTPTERSCNGVYIEFLGNAKVEWTSGSGRYRETIKDEVIYARSRTEAFPKGKLPPGTHTYNFQVQIPNEAPSSCIGQYGEISYVISLVIDRPLWFNKKFQHKLAVLRPFDLSSSFEYSIPLQAEDVKNMCCWPCSSGPIISKLELPFGGYVPGQAIKYKLYVDNNSKDYDMNGIKLTLNQLMYFISRKKERARKTITELAATERNETVLRLTKRVFEGEIVIPAVPPTLIEGTAGIINILYFVQMNIKTGGWHKDSEVIIPVAIGTVPVGGSESNLQTAVEKYLALQLLKTLLAQEPDEQEADNNPLLQD